LPCLISQEWRILEMIAKAVRTTATLMLVLGVFLASHSSAWCQGCGTASEGSSMSCSVQGAKCSGTSEAGKPVPRGACKTVVKATRDSSCACVETRGKVLRVGTHSRTFVPKGGGIGAVAIFTCLGLVALWCLVAIRRPRNTAKE
jgi:hypothetical protein